MKFRIFAHSWISDWNHGNAHFLRGLADALVRLGHEVRCYEEEHSWSASNLRAEGKNVADAAIQKFCQLFPALDVRFYRPGPSFHAFAAEQLREADVLIVHEWTDPEIARTLLALKPRYRFVALLHDTHHRAYTSPGQIARLPLQQFDGVLAFGEALRKIYLELFHLRRVWRFQEAADTEHFRPLPAEQDTDMVWVGNWGDEERTRELEEFLIEPAAQIRAGKFVVHGVRYPRAALSKLEKAGIAYRGYLPNLEAPRSYARSRLSLHVPRRFYANGLSGIPTIRMFEAMACGSALLCSPWTDAEGLFRAGLDYISVPDGARMEGEIRHWLRDDAARQQLGANGLKTIIRYHTCAHRAQELLEICRELAP